MIRDRYLAGVSDAENKFLYSAADEDSLTGALGNAVSTPGPLNIYADGAEYSYNIFYQKIRGRGPGAPEKILGADGIFQIEISDSNQTLFMKGLPFQAKKGWIGKDRNLTKQAQGIIDAAGEGIIIDYSKQGYSACTVEDALHFNGERKKIMAAGRLNKLGHVLADDFLNCDIGAPGLSYDAQKETFDLDNVFSSKAQLHLINTQIIKRPRL